MLGRDRRSGEGVCEDASSRDTGEITAVAGLLELRTASPVEVLLMAYSRMCGRRHN